MSMSLQTLFGLLMIAVGGIKTWLHMGSIPVLSLPTCNGEALTVALGPTGFFNQAHCWGCYVFAVGLAMLIVALYREVRKRRTVAIWMD